MNNVFKILVSYGNNCKEIRIVGWIIKNGIVFRVVGNEVKGFLFFVEIFFWYWEV